MPSRQHKQQITNDTSTATVLYCLCCLCCSDTFSLVSLFVNEVPLHFFVRNIYSFIVAGAVESWVTRSVIHAPVVNRQIVHQVRQIHQPREAGMLITSRTLHQVRLLSRLGKLPFALLKTTAVIPFTVLIDGVNGRAVVHRLEASRTLLVLEIVGKPHTKSPRYFFIPSCDTTLAPSCCPCPVLCAMQVRCSRIAQAGLARRNSGTPSTIHPRCKSVVSGGAAWESIAGLIQRSQGRGYPTEKSEGPKRGKALLWLETDQRHRCQRHSSARRFFALSRLWNW